MTFTDSHGNTVELPQGVTVDWRIGAYAIVKDSIGRFLMVQSGNGLWQFPGGGVEQTETIQQALVREVQEETGYTVVPENQPFFINEQQFYHRREEAFYHSLQLFFLGSLRYTTPDTSLIATEDTSRKQDWIDIAALETTQIHPTIKTLAKKLSC